MRFIWPPHTGCTSSRQSLDPSVPTARRALTLLYRQFAIGRTPEYPAPLGNPICSRLQICDTAERNSALLLSAEPKNTMQTKSAIISLLTDPGIIAVVRAQSASQVLPLSEALIAGGVKVIEVTMTTPNALAAIREASEKLGDRALIGVGTVLDADTARAAIAAGAEFVSRPFAGQNWWRSLTPPIAQLCSALTPPPKRNWRMRPARTSSRSSPRTPWGRVHQVPARPAAASSHRADGRGGCGERR